MKELDRWLADFPGDVAQGVHRAVEILDRARTYARSAARSDWDFAVEIGRLQELGLTECELRWLLFKEFVECADETTSNARLSRSFDTGTGLRFSDRTCFVVTDRGAAALHTQLEGADLTDVPVGAPSARCRSARCRSAHWPSSASVRRSRSGIRRAACCGWTARS